VREKYDNIKIVSFAFRNCSSNRGFQAIKIPNQSTSVESKEADKYFDLFECNIL